VAHSLPFGKLRIDGSMVFSGYILFVIALAERNNEKNKIIKYRGS